MMAEAAKMAEQMGACLIDINMGCPAKKVTGRASGSALMKELQLAGEICAAVVAAVELPRQPQNPAWVMKTTAMPLKSPKLQRKAD